MDSLGARKGHVCVTGGTGYIASSLIRQLLQEGYEVRTTVRSPNDLKKLAILKDLPGAKERLSIVGGDLLREGSFDAAMEGVQGVFHTACPVLPPGHNTDPQLTMIDPSVKGTLNVLRACAKSTTVERVVLTSSCSAIRYDFNRDMHDDPLDETCWSNPEYCKLNQMWYALAKTMAEHEAWRFADEHDLDLVVVNPSFVVGRCLGALPTSTALFVLYLLQGKIEEYPNQIIGFVHIDDVVRTHILVYTKPEAKGRYICSSTVAHWSEVVDTIRAKYPALNISSRCKEGGTELVPHTMSTQKIQQLGLKSWLTLEAMFDDCIHCFTRKGLLPQLNCADLQ